jgi:hypothetical protein
MKYSSSFKYSSLEGRYMKIKASPDGTSSKKTGTYQVDLHIDQTEIRVKVHMFYEDLSLLPILRNLKQSYMDC